jgi:hypothetical protein
LGNGFANITGALTVTSGNVTAGNFIGTLANGTSNVAITLAGGNVNLTAGGTTSLIVTPTGANITGTLNATGNANTGNIGATNGVFTNISGTLSGSLANGTSNVSIPASGGNINLTAGGTTTLVVTSTGANITGTLNTGTGNATVGNLIGTVANGTSNINIVNNGNISLVRSGTTRLLANNTGVTVTGAFSATTKSFLIEHPLDTSMYLQYGSLESPYHGVRLTGEGVVKNGKCTIQLPDYIRGLVKQEGSQVQLTNYKHGRTLYIDGIDVTENMFVVKSNWKLGELRFFWSFTAIRKDVDDLVVEY